MSKFGIKGSWNGRRADGRACTIMVLEEYDVLPPGYGQQAPTRVHIMDHLRIDQEPADRIDKGQYRVVSTGEVVTCTDPKAP